MKATRAIIAAVIIGSAIAFLTYLGIQAANAFGAHIAKLSLPQLIVVWVAGGIVGAAASLLRATDHQPASFPKPSPAAIPPPAAPAPPNPKP